MFTYDVPPVRVRYADTDQMGYVYYGNYARYYEIGRVEALRSLGFHYKEMEASGVMMPVYENRSRYLRPARYDDLLTIRVTIREMPGVRIVFHYDIYNQNGEHLNTGETTLVFMQSGTGRITKAPTDLTTRLKPFFEPAV
ncbi:acyl-CoA thioesterase [Larkinella arboricola]|uniref:Acyl-CoA thioester hydrolase n=1 Tax=Larkinella arboricola TaxID=643671 RepID=A0A327X8S1_LARAB|nr:thioesterase family protein [Larkinella arboricola]RAK00047.1 acyl-CoA thioester hydrolase [Larkinella arboricola]